MPELDPFDARIQTAVHAFANRAQTRVDAAAVAARTIGRRPTGPWAVLNRAVPVPVPVIVASLLAVAFAGWSLSGGGPFPLRILFGPSPVPTVEPAAPTPSPAPSPTPTIPPDATAFVSGTAISTQVAPTASPPGEGDVPPMTGAVLQVTTTTDDDRATGTGTFRLDVDAGSGLTLGFVSGTFQLNAGAGEWEGTCTGASWSGLTAFYDGFAGATVSCWLRGSGSYSGLTFYLNYRFAGWQSPDEVVGTILPAEPPSP